MQLRTGGDAVRPGVRVGSGVADVEGMALGETAVGVGLVAAVGAEDDGGAGAAVQATVSITNHAAAAPVTRRGTPLSSIGLREPYHRLSNRDRSRSGAGFEGQCKIFGGS